MLFRSASISIDRSSGRAHYYKGDHDEHLLRLLRWHVESPAGIQQNAHTSQSLLQRAVVHSLVLPEYVRERVEDVVPQRTVEDFAMAPGGTG